MADKIDIVQVFREARVRSRGRHLEGLTLDSKCRICRWIRSP